MILSGRIWADVPGTFRLPKTCIPLECKHFTFVVSPPIVLKHTPVTQRFSDLPCAHNTHRRQTDTHIPRLTHTLTLFHSCLLSVLRHMLESCLPETQHLEPRINLWEMG